MSDGGSLKSFRDLRLIGKGSFGRVYRCIRCSDNQEYAIKEVNIKSMSQREREDAVNEVRILASVNHNMVIRYYDAFIENDRLFIVTELARGGDIGAKVKRHAARNEPMSEDMIWGFFIQTCQGLRSLHSANILHRDIKAQNIFLVAAREVKIGDLGVAKVTKGGMAYTQIGTPYYMSPEIWRRRPYNKKSDIWSVGCLLYELAALKHPFEARDERSLAEKVIRGVYPSIPASYSQDLSMMINLLLQVDPAKRPTVDDILNHPIVQKRMADAAIKCGPDLDGHTCRNLVDTIRVPRQLSQLQSKLPGSKYPANKPGTSQGRRNEDFSVPPTAQGRDLQVRKSLVLPTNEEIGVKEDNEKENDKRRLPGLVDNRRPSGGCGKRPYVPVPYHERKALHEKMLRAHR